MKRLGTPLVLMTLILAEILYLAIEIGDRTLLDEQHDAVKLGPTC